MPGEEVTPCVAAQLIKRLQKATERTRIDAARTRPVVPPHTKVGQWANHGLELDPVLENLARGNPHRSQTSLPKSFSQGSDSSRDVDLVILAQRIEEPRYVAMTAPQSSVIS
jgi:hypothetical protein